MPGCKISNASENNTLQFIYLKLRREGLQDSRIICSLEGGHCIKKRGFKGCISKVY